MDGSSSSSDQDSEPDLDPDAELLKAPEPVEAPKPAVKQVQSTLVMAVVLKAPKPAEKISGKLPARPQQEACYNTRGLGQATKNKAAARASEVAGMQMSAYIISKPNQYWKFWYLPVVFTHLVPTHWHSLSTP